MKQDELTLLLLRRCAMARNPLLGCWFSLHVQQQRLRAHWLAHGAIWTKRMLDIVVSLLLLVLAAPLLGLIALMIKLEDGGAIFFAQTRVGQDGREFKMFKVRSM